MRAALLFAALLLPALLVTATAHAQVRFAVAREGTVTTYRIDTDGVSRLDELRVTDVRAMAWARGGPLFVVRAGEYGEIRGHRYRRRRRGDFVRLRVAAGGQIWIDRCLERGDNVQEEGCVRRRYLRLTPAPASDDELPPRADPPPAAAPATPRLSIDIADRDLFVVDCHDRSTVRIVDTGDCVLTPPSTHWLSTEPPIALLRVEYAGSGEGDPEIDRRQGRLLRGCQLDQNESRVQLAPDGGWAERQDRPDGAVWILHRAGSVIGEVPGGDLVFEGGDASGLR